jgi:DNA-binding IclR family transcriptional regulator
MSGENPTSGTVKSDRTLFAIVEELQRRDEAGVTELADSVGLSKSTVHKHLKTLEELQYVVREDGAYRPGFKFLTVGGRLRDHNELCHLANVKAGDLVTETGQMVLVSTLEHGEGVFTYVDRSRYDIKNILLGERFSLHATASGKAMLAEYSDERIDALVDGGDLPGFTDTTVTEREALLEQIDEVRDRGFALNMEERQRGVRAVSAAVTHPETGTICALTVAGPAHRLPKDELEGEHANAVLGVVNELELQIRY